MLNLYLITGTQLYVRMLEEGKSWRRSWKSSYFQTEVCNLLIL